MNAVPWMNIVLGLLAIVIGWWMVRRGGARTVNEKWLPVELRKAELKFAEQTFRIRRPISLIARADRGYFMDGKIRLAEFKTRASNRVYSSDVIELSAQRMAIEVSTGDQVSKVGYVFIQDPSGKRRSVQRVQLMGKYEMMTVAWRREGILSGAIEPRYAESAGLCRQCEFRKECRPDLK